MVCSTEASCRSAIVNARRRMVVVDDAKVLEMRVAVANGAIEHE
jgi:flavin-binding protein dodecin